MAKFLMTNEHVRRRLFWLLQRLSSYSLWQKKWVAWALFAEKYEEALKTWPEEKTEGFDPEAIIWIYDALRLYDEGLAELATGNRQVWQRKTGKFHQLARPIDLVRSFFWASCHIKTDEPVPCDGIWEPITVKYHHKLLVIPTEVKGFTTLGAFNYFIKGMKAPLQDYNDFGNIRYRDVHLRLVWEDSRYCDGMIPDESEYFLHEAQGERIQCRTGDKCPHSGQWATLAGGHQSLLMSVRETRCRKRRSLKVVSAQKILRLRTGTCWIAMTTVVYLLWTRIRGIEYAA